MAMNSSMRKNFKKSIIISLAHISNFSFLNAYSWPTKSLYETKQTKTPPKMQDCTSQAHYVTVILITVNRSVLKQTSIK